MQPALPEGQRARLSAWLQAPGSRSWPAGAELAFCGTGAPRPRGFDQSALRALITPRLPFFVLESNVKFLFSQVPRPSDFGAVFQRGARFIYFSSPLQYLLMHRAFIYVGVWF